MSLRHLRHALAAQAFLALLVPGPRAHAVPTVDETAHTQAAVLAVEDHWLRAEGTGDTAWLEELLLPGYRSVNADGGSHDRAAILAGAARNRGSDKAMRQIHSYLAAHPSSTSVLIDGDLAIVSFSDAGAAPTRVRSSDVFAYRGGHWRAVYSQHSSAGH